MIRIVALNDPSKDETYQDDETIAQVTKEAQETIAVSEYMRSLSLKQNGNSSFALTLFEDLLKTQVLSDVPDDDKDNKLFSVKYNCFRNIGLIYEERGELRLALKFLLQAVELDDSDVNTQCKIGRISLKLYNLHLAKLAFEKCLERNPNHNGAKDGLLETLCLMEDIDQAYGFALKCFEDDSKHGRAIRVLKEIRARFLGSLEYYDGMYGRAPQFDDNCPIKYDPEKSVFPPPKEIGFTEENYAKLSEDFKIAEKSLNWITIGKLILRVYNYCIDNNYSLVSWFEWKDWIQEESADSHEFLQPAVPDVEMEEDVKTNGNIEDVPMNGDDGNTSPPKVTENKEEAENMEVDGETSDQDPKKVNNRRRCSDLDFLKEWGWHKNRRSSRKKQKEEEETGDTTVNGFIRRILANYFTTSFDSNRSPFALACGEHKSLDDSNIQNQSKNDAEDEEKFFELTKESFEEFIETFKNREFDVAIPMFHWLRFVSLYWDKTTIPSEIILLFKKIYALYEGYLDYHSLHHLDEDEFKSTFRMALFYFELKLDEFEETKTEIPEEYIRQKDFLQLNIGFVEEDMPCTEMLTRLIWLSYRMQIHNNNYKDALGYLYKLEEVYEVPKYSEISVELKNCQHNKLIDFKTVKELIVKIERKINLASVQQLYESKNYEELIEILRESIIYSTEPKVNTDHLTLKIQSQIEVFLECLWSLNRISECLQFAEKSLRYSFDNFLLAPTEYRLEEWASLVNYCLVYIDAAIKDEDGSEILYVLEDHLSRLVQTLTEIITHQLDTPTEKNNLKCHLINLTIPWTVLYHLVLKENDISSAANRKKSPEGGEEDLEALPNSLVMFFTAHEYLGRKLWCMKDNGKLLISLLDVLAPIYRTPLLEPHREVIAEYLEQTTYCLYGYPAKKAKLRHIEEHDAKNIDLTWERAIQLFDLYRPDTLPEFDSYKLSSINVEMEQLLQKILPLIPKCLDITPFTGEIKKFINGSKSELPKEINILPAKIASIYYLLADFYFKNQETGKAIKFYINDLTMKPDRFDAWASLSLCKQSRLEMKLNSSASISVKDFLEFADQTINCFNQCLKLKRTITILTEYASFTYHLHSFCSRNLKQSSETLSMENFSAIEERKDKFLNISLKCFSEVSEAASDPNHELNCNKNQEESDDNHDDKWYYHFMLGKIAEKKKEQPLIYLEHYQKAAKFLYEDNATYPIKINHTYPPHLAIESLEVFYRISACIMKYLEQHSKINKPTAKLFLRVLKEVASSPFAFNRAKINKGNINAMKNKLNTSNAENGSAKQPKIAEEVKIEETVQQGDDKMETDEVQAIPNFTEMSNETKLLPQEVTQSIEKEKEIVPKAESPEIVETPIQAVIKTSVSVKSSRRGSQESAVTTNTTNTSTPSSSSSDSSADSSSDSDSSSSDETDVADKENIFVEQEVVDNIYKLCIKNLEECVSRFPEHYKSIYRLVHHFTNIGDSIEKCKQLLLSSNYKTTLGNQIGGLFSERKNNNFFNGIWRVPTQEIDRPGNFTTHVSKCVVILMEVLKKSNDYDTLVDLALHLQRNPEADKKYLNDADKKELFHQAVTCCVQAFKNKMREIPTENNEERSRELLSLMLDIFKIHRKTVKILQAKDQNLFSGVLVEVYKEYVKDRMGLPDNANLTDLAMKLCNQELNYRKNLEKGIVTVNPNPPMQFQQQPSNPSPILVKSVSEINKTIASTSGGSSTPNPPNSTTTQVTNKTSTQSTSSGSSARTKPRNSGSSKSQAASMNSMLMSLYSNPALFAQLTDPTNYMHEYYKSILGGQSSPPATSTASSGLTTQQLTAAMMSADPMTLMASLYPSLASQVQSSSQSSSKATSSYDKKYMESLKNLTYSGTGTGSNSSSSSKASHLLGLQQNLLSNSLSITTTTVTATTSSKPTKSLGKSSASGSSKQGSSASVSITKSDVNKYNSMFAAKLKLPDLPKSLSITPSLPAAAKSNRVSEKGKPPRAKPSASSNFNVNSTLSITPDVLANSLSSDMQASYQSFLKNYSQQIPMAGNKKSSPINVSSASSASLLKPLKHKSSTQHSEGSQPKKSHTQQSSSTKSVAQLPYDFGKNIASSFSGLPMSSPTLSNSPFSQHTPPLANSPSLLNLSPQKTLQQKLAERKQQNQQQKKKQEDDVIVLD